MLLRRLFNRLMSTSNTRSRSASPSTPTDAPPVSKRPRIASPPLSTIPAPTLPYDRGMHLAPMVRIGTLPTRLLSLEYGASLVWGPEIVDKAIIGCTRQVNPRTGVISFIKGGRSIFECHPIEKSRLIFQLGSSDPILAREAMKVIEGDVGGVGLNCGCPKAFSLQGGMGAALLKDPERLCSILDSLVSSTSLPIDAKIRLLPLPSSPTPSTTSSSPADEDSDDPTLPLIRQILSTGIKCLTVHCRTQTMRSSEPALHSRLLSINKSLAKLRSQASPDESWTKIPVVCNGDVTGGDAEEEGEGLEDTWGNFRQICKETGVNSVMIARAAEANLSCFRREGLEDPIKVVIPRLLKIAILTNNHFSNTKYVLNAINLHATPTPPGKELNRDIKLKMNKAKTYHDMGEIFGIPKEEIERLEQEGTVEELKGMVPSWTKRAESVEKSEGVAEVEEKK